MNILILIPIINDDPLEEAVQHMEKAVHSLKSIFSNMEAEPSIVKWFDISEEGSVQGLSTILVLLRDKNLVYFGRDWKKFKNLQAVYHICELYGIQRMEE